MKTFKLAVHNEKSYKSKYVADQEILLCAKDFPDVKAGDVVELYHPEDEWNRLLLQVKCLPDDYQQRDTVSIEQGISNTFSLKTYNNKIVVNKVEPKNVCVDLVEILFKEQYFGRSDMWRMNTILTNTCVYVKKNLEFAGMRATVHELWSQGENVTSGLITEDTRVVFRSPTAVVQIFIQISTEMWDFDLHGDLYFEKAVNGFLTDLFARWKDQKCLHDVTIVMFSRTYYNAKSFDEFPPAVRECLQIDCRGCIYEDFYRVVIQNERYEEWSGVLRELRTIFNTYEDILNFHRPSNEGWKMPKGTISMAAQGNFLETLNMSLNLFEKYYLDRNFDRTGKVSVVITPGPGVFEVDRQLANITKQRTIDCGVGSDLVCMGEQPLHAAPLFKFHSKSSDDSIEVGDDYNIPHWLNHSFYMSKNQIENHMNSPFVPRIKPPPALVSSLVSFSLPYLLHRNDDSHETNIPFVDYDEYDAQVFKLPSGTIPPRPLKDPFSSALGPRGSALPKTFAEAKRTRVPRTRHISDEVCAYNFDRRDADKEKSPAITIPSRQNSSDDLSLSFGCYPIQGRGCGRDSFGSSESDELVHQRCVVGSAGSPVSHSRGLHNYRPRRALINPFAPSRLQFKMTSNRRRWVHAFPVGVWFEIFKVNLSIGILAEAFVNVSKYFDVVFKRLLYLNKNTLWLLQFNICIKIMIYITYISSSHHRDIIISNFFSPGNGKRNPRGVNLHFGGNKTRRVFGSEQDWSPDMNTGYDWRVLPPDPSGDLRVSRLTKAFFDGDIQSSTFIEGIAVDWKSLTIPASLPLTTDYFPDRHSLQYDYYVASYQFDVAEEGWGPSSVDEKDWLVYHRPPLTTQQVFMELISQRLGQGFQLITKNSPKQSEPKPEPPKVSPSTSGLFGLINEPDNECYMNIGRIYHKLISRGSSIGVTWWRPSHPTPQLQYEYRYRFQDPDSFTYDVSWTNFSNERLENYNWNHLDKYICTQGDYWECGLIDSLKYWRSRFFLLPLNNSATKKIIDKETTRCDIYEERSLVECRELMRGFTKFLEAMNKIRRSKPKPEVGGSTAGGTTQGDSSPRKLENEGLVGSLDGLSLIQNQAGLPSNSFISREAVFWCRRNVAGVDTTSGAVALLQRLMDDQLVLHCSGNPQHKFINGFYLYYVPQKLLAKPGEPLLQVLLYHHLATPGADFNLLFQNEWCEVAVLPLHEEEEPQTQDDTVLMLDVKPTQQRKQQLSVSVFLSVPLNCSHSGWLQMYSRQFGKGCTPFLSVCLSRSVSAPWNLELQLQWMVVTGCILGDLVYSYARKATLCGFHLLPVPCDPFALPYNNMSDPLRGPIFIPLDMDALPKALLEDGRQGQATKRKPSSFGYGYGFGSNGQSGDDSEENFNHQYVHCTAGMFILIPDLSLDHHSQTPEPLDPVEMSKRSSADLHKLYVARQAERPEKQVGFLWTWNYMSSRRWRSNNTGDEIFQDTMLADFRRFCSNDEGRLTEFWDSFKGSL
ncbi:hypothetical protein EGW08_002471, partial [Elysia chlorotica]